MYCDDAFLIFVGILFLHSLIFPFRSIATDRENETVSKLLFGEKEQAHIIKYTVYRPCDKSELGWP